MKPPRPVARAGTSPRPLRLAVMVVAAVVLQTTVVARLPLPGAPPDLVLVAVVGAGLLLGLRSGMLTGFAAGLLADLAADHELGRLAVAYVVVGYLSGLLHEEADGSVLLPAGVAAAGAALAVLLFAGEGVLLADPRVGGGALWRSLASTVPYCALLTPLVLPAVAALLRPVDRGR